MSKTHEKIGTAPGSECVVCCVSSARLWGNQIVISSGAFCSLMKQGRYPDTCKNAICKEEEERKGPVGRKNSLWKSTGGAQCVQRLEKARHGCWSVGRMWGEMMMDFEVGMRDFEMPRIPCQGVLIFSFGTVSKAIRNLRNQRPAGRWDRL